MPASTALSADPASAMDRMYRYQRHFYDLTRKFYLLGRDVLLRRMEVPAHGRVLEIGCGTGRNLVALARRHPNAQFYGLDASSEMLRTAAKKIDAAGLGDRIQLRQGLAETLRYDATFGLEQPFDAVFFSYSLSMIPPWREAFGSGVANVKTGGDVHIVDFWDQRDLPRLFRAALSRWLLMFGVQHPPDLIPYLQSEKDIGKGTLALEPLYGRYAVLARFTKSSPH